MEPLRIVGGRDEQVALWMLEQLPHITNLPSGYVAIGAARGNDLIGGCLYTSYSPCPGGGDIQIWAVGNNWLSRRTIAVFLGYPFVQLKCHRVTALTPKGNKPSRKLLEGLGFIPEGKIRKGYNTRSDMMVYGMLRGDCRWHLI